MSILQSVIEEARVLQNEDGDFNLESLEVEVEFEARERGLSDEQVKEAVAYALSRYA